jgi:predicted RNase H-like HicB family nuclease
MIARAADGCKRMLGRRDVRARFMLMMSETFAIELEQEADGRWIAEVLGLPGVLSYGQSRDEAIAKVQALALRVLAERLEHAEAPGQLLNVSFRAA